MKTNFVRLPAIKALILAAACGGAINGCAPTAEQSPPAKPAAIQTRKTIGQTTQNVLELAEAVNQGGVPAVMSIESSGIEMAADAYRTNVGKVGMLAVEQKMQLYQAEHGSLPKNHAEFLTRIIGKDQPDGIRLPLLPYYQEWAYDPEAKKLVVIEFPAKKEQREKETTGPSGL